MEEQPMEWPRLHRLAADGDIQGLGRQLRGGNDPNARRVDGATALHIAAGRGQAGAARALLENGADPNTRTRQGATPLEFAVSHAAHVIELLIQGGARPNLVGSEAGRPLRVAIEEGKINAIASLLRGGADPSLTASDGLTPLGFASGKGKAGAVAEFVQHANNAVHHRDGFGATALHHAACAGQPEVIRILLAANADVMSRYPDGSTPLHLAAAADRPEAVAALLAGGADPNARDDQRYTPLHVAARQAKRKTVGLLLDAAEALAADASTPGETPLHLAVLHNDAPEVTTALLDAGADPNTEFSAETEGEHIIPLAAAAGSSRRALVEALIAGGANPNDQRGDKSPLKAAMKSGDIETVTALLAAGADPNGRSGEWPPLHIAAGEDEEVVGTLLRHGADARVVYEGMTALHCVVEGEPSGAARIMQLLLTHGASQRQPGGEDVLPPLQQVLGQDDPDPDCINVLLSDAFATMDDWRGGLDALNNSCTPLHAAAGNPKVPPEVVERLLSGPFLCDPEAEGADGTPLMLAAEAGSLAAIEVLLNRGADPNGADDDLRPLVCAVECGQVAAARALLDAGAEVDASEHLDVALRAASAAWASTRTLHPAESDVDVCHMLVAKLVEANDVMAPEGDLRERLAGATPFHWIAGFAWDATIVERCIKTKADARLKDQQGWSLLHWAACCNPSDRVLQWLLDNGGARTARTRDGKTALDLASASCNENAQRVLVQGQGKSSRGGLATTRKSLAKRH